MGLLPSALCLYKKLAIIKIINVIVCDYYKCHKICRMSVKKFHIVPKVQGSLETAVEEKVRHDEDEI